MSSEEQRGAPRIRHPFMLRYRPAGPSVAPWSVTPLLDLSGTGARFLSDRPLVQGEALELHLMLPGSQQPVALDGQVAWIKGGAKLGLMEVGVSLAVTNPSAQALLDEAVRHFLAKRLKR